MTEQTPAPPSKRPVGRFLRGFWRLMLFGLLVAFITVLVYYGTPYVYRYLVTPVQNNRLAVNQLQRAQGELGELMTSQFENQRQRIAQLEADLAAERERRSELEATLSQQADTFSAQATAQTDLTERLETQGQAISALDENLNEVETILADLEAAVARLAEPDAEATRIQAQIRLLQAQQAVLKAYLHLLENNAGQAQVALADADRALEELAALLPPARRTALNQIQAQLDEVTTTLEERPFIAVQELEILWGLLQELGEAAGG